MSNLYPEKIYVELTTRCNLRCRMCVKYTTGSCIAEEVPEAVIGFQSNGILLDEEKSVKLISAGLSTICLSLDSLEENETDIAEGHSLTAVTRAIAGLVAAKRRVAAGHFRIGLEMILTKQNIQELPKFVQWAVDHNADYCHPFAALQPILGGVKSFQSQFT